VCVYYIVHTHTHTHTNIYVYKSLLNILKYFLLDYFINKINLGKHVGLRIH